MSIEEKLGDAEYFASTDYNQRLEEKAEAEYEEKAALADDTGERADRADLDTLIAQKDFTALYARAKEPLSEADALKLADVGDKDIHIALARNESITDRVARRLIGTVYLAHKNLLANPNLSDEVKEELKGHLAQNPIYRDLLEGI